MTLYITGVLKGKIKEYKKGIGTRQGTATGQKSSHISPSPKARSIALASRMANQLEGLEFPATKSKVKDYIQEIQNITTDRRTP
jgi:hypothetical protein